MFLLGTGIAWAAAPGGYYQAWSDEFNGTSFDPAKWSYYSLGGGAGSSYSTNSISIGNGMANFTEYSQNGTNYFNSLTSENKFQEKYGYYEASIKFNSSPGEWGFFYLQSRTLQNAYNTYTRLNIPTDGTLADPAISGVEVDIMEHRAVNGSNNSVTNLLHNALHWNGYDAAEQSMVYTADQPSLGSGFHTYGVLWTPTNYTFYYDGQAMWTPTSPVSARMEFVYLGVTSSTSLTWAGTVPTNGYGSLGTSTTGMSVDYVRYYAPNTTKIWQGGASGSWTNAVNWLSGSALAATDDISFDMLSTNQLSTVLGVDTSVNSITMGNPSGAVSISSNTLTIGAGGIDMLVAQTNLIINSTVALSAPQSWHAGTGGILTVNGPVLTSGNFLAVTDEGMVTLSNTVSGTGGLIKSGSGTLNLAGSNSYTGGTILYGGTVSIGGATNIGGDSSRSLMFSGGTLRISGTAMTNLNGLDVNWTSFNGGLNIATNANTFTLTNNIAGPGGLTKLGAGTLVLNGVNTYSNGTMVSGGLLLFGTANSIPASGGLVTNNAVVAFNYAGIQSSINLLAPASTGTVALTANNLNEGINFNNAGLSNVFLGVMGTITNNLNNHTPYVNFASNGSNIWKLGGGGGTMFITNAITGGDSVIIGGASTGLYSVVQFSGSNSYNGSTLVSGSTILKVNNNAGLGNSSVIVSNACLQLSNVNVTNALSLSGNAGANVANYATLSVVGGSTSTISGVVTLLGNGAVKMQNNSGTKLIISGGIVGTNGNYSMSLYASDVSGGSVTVTNSPINLGSGTLIGNGININVASNVVGGLVFNWGGSAVKLGVDNAFLGAPTLALGNSSTANTLDLNGHSLMVGSLANSTFQPANNIVISVDAATFTVSNNSGNVFGGSLTGAGMTLAKAGSATLTLTGTNTYGGGTTIAAGTLRYGAQNALPTSGSVTLGGGSLDLGGYSNTVGAVTIGSGIISNGTLRSDASFAITDSGDISANLAGSGALSKSGNGTLSLSGSNSFSGGLTVSGGTLALSSSGTLGGGNISISSGAALDLSAHPTSYRLGSGQSLLNDGAISGGGGLIIGSGALVQGGGSFLSGTNEAGGTILPGWPPKTQSWYDLILNAGSTNAFDIASTNNHDMIIVSDSLVYNGNYPYLKLDLNGTGTNAWVQSDNLGGRIVLYDNTFSGAGWDGTNAMFQLADFGATPNGGVLLTNGAAFWVDGGSGQTNWFKINYNMDAGTGGAGNDVVLTVITDPSMMVPEPGSALLFVVAGSTCWLCRRVRRKTCQLPELH